MPDRVTKKRRSEIMAAVRSRGNKETELRLASILRTNRITGWRRHQRLAGCPDFVFKAERLAIFVDGCFWHGCRHHCRMPESNGDYWRRKIARNIKRDRLTNIALGKAGWRVLRIWSHEFRRPENILKRLSSELNERPPLGKHAGHCV